MFDYKNEVKALIYTKNTNELVSAFTHNPKVVGSNPASATTKTSTLVGVFSFYKVLGTDDLRVPEVSDKKLSGG